MDPRIQIRIRIHHKMSWIRKTGNCRWQHCTQYKLFSFYYSGSGMFIQIPDPNFPSRLRILTSPHPGSRIHGSKRYWIRIRNTDLFSRSCSPSLMISSAWKKELKDFRLELLPIVVTIWNCMTLGDLDEFSTRAVSAGTVMCSIPHFKTLTAALMIRHGIEKRMTASVMKLSAEIIRKRSSPSVDAAASTHFRNN